MLLSNFEKIYISSSNIGNNFEIIYQICSLHLDWLRMEKMILRFITLLQIIFKNFIIIFVNNQKYQLFSIKYLELFEFISFDKFNDFRCILENCYEFLILYQWKCCIRPWILYC